MVEPEYERLKKIVYEWSKPADLPPSSCTDIGCNNAISNKTQLQYKADNKNDGRLFRMCKARKGSPSHVNYISPRLNTTELKHVHKELAEAKRLIEKRKALEKKNKAQNRRKKIDREGRKRKREEVDVAADGDEEDEEEADEDEAEVVVEEKAKRLRKKRGAKELHSKQEEDMQRPVTSIATTTSNSLSSTTQTRASPLSRQILEPSGNDGTVGRSPSPDLDILEISSTEFGKTDKPSLSKTITVVSVHYFRAKDLPQVTGDTWIFGVPFVQQETWKSKHYSPGVEIQIYDPIGKTWGTPTKGDMCLWEPTPLGKSSSLIWTLSSVERHRNLTDYASKAAQRITDTLKSFGSGDSLSGAGDVPTPEFVQGSSTGKRRRV